MSAALPLTVGILTVSAEADHGAGAERLAELLEADGHTVLSRLSLSAAKDPLDTQLSAWCAHPAIDTVMVLGGIGVGPKDVTTELVSSYLLREAVGFGELARRIVGEREPLVAVSLRALAGVGARTLLFALPSSPRHLEQLYAPLVGPLCDARKHGSLAALVPQLRAID
jgi:molybdenum cofactor biosynthesis protein B